MASHTTNYNAPSAGETATASGANVHETIKTVVRQMSEVYDFSRASEQEILNGLQQRMGTHLDASSLQVAKEKINSIIQTQEAMNPPSLLPVQHPHHTSQAASRYGSSLGQQDMNHGQYAFDIFQGALSNEVDFAHPYFANFGQSNSDSLEPIVDLPQPLRTYFDRSSMPLSQVS